MLSSWYGAALDRELVIGETVTTLFCGSMLHLTRTPAGVVADLGGRSAEVCIADGVVFVWFDPRGGPPTFRLPELDHKGWTRTTFDVVDLCARPELVMRDLADYEHFRSVHGYHDVQPETLFYADGPRCGLELSFTWPMIIGSRIISTKARFKSECFGVGYQLTEVTGLRGGLRGRHRVLPTPLDDRSVRIRLGLEVQFSGWLRLARFPEIYHAVARRYFRRDVEMDAKAWVNLGESPGAAFIEPAATELRSHDRSLSAFWAWAEQFEPAPASC